MGKYTKAEINGILNLEGWLNQQIDVFNLFAVLTIGVSNNPGEWEVKQQTYSESVLPINIEDFDNCQNEKDVKAVFHKSIQCAVAAEMFKSASRYDDFTDVCTERVVVSVPKVEINLLKSQYPGDPVDQVVVALIHERIREGTC
ncbi:MAG: hypothetical protein NWF00_06655 [Candidatus Bathyarchaeota archaeon]|nr:hypothetical protein [Candidatus Bathyarchaeota archaeon]